MTYTGFRLPRRFMRGRTLPVMLTVLALASGVALVAAIDLANRAVLVAFSEVVDTMAGRASLQVTAGDGGLVPEEMATTIAAVAGVELAVPVVSAVAYTTTPPVEMLTVHGVDFANDRAVRVYEPAHRDDAPVVDDMLVFLSKADSVVITTEFAARRDLRLHDHLEVETPVGRRTLTVRGMLAPRGIARVQGGNLLVMDVGAAEDVFTQAGRVTRIDVVVDGSARVEIVADRIAAMLPPGLRVDTPAHRKMQLDRVIAAAQTLLSAVSLLGMVAAFLVAHSRLSTMFEARLGEFAVLRAVGVRQRRVWWELVKEALLLGLAGVALGLPLGVFLGWALLPVIGTATALASKLSASHASLVVRPVSLAMAAGTGLAAILLSVSVPAWRAARLSVGEALGTRTLETPERSSRRGLGARLLLLALSAAMAMAHAHFGDAASGLAASGLVVVSGAVMTRPLLGALGAWLERILPRVAGPPGRFAAAALARSPRRAALAVATLGVGFGAVLWLWTVAISFERSVLDVMPGKLRGDLSVASVHFGAGFVEAPLEGKLIDELAAVPGVATVVGERAIDWPFAGAPIAVDAYDPPFFVDPRFGPMLLIGRRLPDALGAVARGDAVIVSENFVHNLGLGVGEIVTLDTPRGPLALRIAAVSPDFLSPRGTVNLSRDVFRHWWGDEQVVRGLVVADGATTVEQVRRAIEERLGRRHTLRIIDLPTLIASLGEQVRRAFASLHVLAALVLIVVMVGVGDALAASVHERSRELGVVRAVGGRRGAVRRMVLWEAVILATFGLVLALGLGLGLGTMWVLSTFPALLGWTLTFHWPLPHLAALAVAIVVTCVAAAWLPARHAGRLDPIAALRVE